MLNLLRRVYKNSKKKLKFYISLNINKILKIVCQFRYDESELVVVPRSTQINSKNAKTDQEYLKINFIF